MYSTGFPLIWCTAFYHGLYISYFPDRYPFLFLPMQDSVSQTCLETTALHTPKHNCSFWQWLVAWLTVELVKQREFIRMKWAVLGIKLVHRNKLWKQVGKHKQSHPLNEMVCDECLALYSKRVQLPRHVERKHTAVTYSFEQGSWQEVLGSFSEKALTQCRYCWAKHWFVGNIFLATNVKHSTIWAAGELTPPQPGAVHMSCNICNPGVFYKKYIIRRRNRVCW